LNKFIGLGYLTKDPVFKTTKSGKNVCEFSIGITNIVSGSTVFMDIETWNKVAENCNRFLSKGRKVLIEGRLQQSSWTSQSGEKRSKIYCVGDIVTFLDKHKEDKQQIKAEEVAEKIIQEDEFADIPF
jgi:single-strand DNA-binding protein